MADPIGQKNATGWRELFSNQPWYVREHGSEREFSGILAAVPTHGESSDLQRRTFYRLGDRAIYTGARPLAALDELVGQTVIIRGKAVEFRLEGASVREIWPAAIRRNP